MRILALAARLPYPLDTGAKIRSSHILKTLASRHDVTLLSFIGGNADMEYAKNLKASNIEVIPVSNPMIDKGISPVSLAKGLFSRKPLSIEKYNTNSFRNKYEELLLQKFDVIHCEHFHMAHYISPTHPGKKTFDAHNVESEIVQRWYEQETNPLKKVALKWHVGRMVTYEHKILEKFDLVMAVSDRDRDALTTLGGFNNVRTIENGVDISFFSCANNSNSIRTKNIVFVGSMDWRPNDDGIRHFLSSVFPLIVEKEKDVRLFVVGRKPSKELLRLAGDDARVVVTGGVDDVRPYIEDSSVYVVPLRVGGGTRLKVLEAFSMGKAVVSTSLGCEGIDCKNGDDIVIADEPQEFADAVLKLFNNHALNTKLGENARNLVASKYSWDVIGNKLLTEFDVITV